MSRLLFTVTDTFLIRNRGLILFPGIQAAADESFRIGTPVLLRRPDCSERPAEISGHEMATPKLREAIPILIKDLSKTDVPIGTEVWSIADPTH